MFGDSGDEGLDVTPDMLLESMNATPNKQHWTICFGYKNWEDRAACVVTSCLDKDGKKIWKFFGRLVHAKAGPLSTSNRDQVDILVDDEGGLCVGHFIFNHFKHESVYNYWEGVNQEFLDDISSTGRTFKFGLFVKLVRRFCSFEQKDILIGAMKDFTVEIQRTNPDLDRILEDNEGSSEAFDSEEDQPVVRPTTGKKEPRKVKEAFGLDGSEGSLQEIRTSDVRAATKDKGKAHVVDDSGTKQKGGTVEKLLASSMKALHNDVPINVSPPQKKPSKKKKIALVVETEDGGRVALNGGKKKGNNLGNIKLPNTDSEGEDLFVVKSGQPIIRTYNREQMTLSSDVAFERALRIQNLHLIIKTTLEIPISCIVPPLEGLRDVLPRNQIRHISKFFVKDLRGDFETRYKRVRSSADTGDHFRSRKIQEELAWVAIKSFSYSKCNRILTVLSKLCWAPLCWSTDLLPSLRRHALDFFELRDEMVACSLNSLRVGSEGGT